MRKSRLLAKVWIAVYMLIPRLRLTSWEAVCACLVLMKNITEASILPLTGGIGRGLSFMSGKSGKKEKDFKSSFCLSIGVGLPRKTTTRTERNLLTNPKRGVWMSSKGNPSSRWNLGMIPPESSITIPLRAMSATGFKRVSQMGLSTPPLPVSAKSMPRASQTGKD